MSVWDSLVGQKPVIDMLSRIAQGDPSQITQSWLICGPPGSGRSNMARAFAAALESPDHGMSAEPTRVTQQVLAGTHPDVTVLTTNKVTIGIDQVREIITTSEQMPATAPWRIIIIEDVDRMLERTTNVLLKEIEEPAEHCIWLLCAPSAQDVLPTIRSRTRIVNLAVPSTQAVAGFLTSTTNVEPKVAQRAARLAEGHIGIAKLYATDERVMSDRDELVVGVLNLARASDAVLLAGNLIDNAKAQAEADANRITAGQEAEFRRINGLAPSDRIPPKLRGAFNQIAKKDDVKRLVTRRTRDVLDRALNSIASIYRDVAVLQNNAEDSVGLINLENRSSITELSVRLNRAGAVTRLDEVAHARKRLTSPPLMSGGCRAQRDWGRDPVTHSPQYVTHMSDTGTYEDFRRFHRHPGRFRQGCGP
jgi:DNA polymerase-3 subunit delta'